MRRRHFLKLLPSSLLLTACQAPPASALRVTALKGSLPNLFPRQFHQAFPQIEPIALTQSRQLSELFQQLQAWKRRSDANFQPRKGLVPFNVPWIGTAPEVPIADLASLGDFWLPIAIRQGLIQPIDAGQIPAWATIDPKLQAIAKRNDRGEPDPNGKLWGIPYRINSTVLLYRKDLFKQAKLAPPTDWADLWRSDLTGKISLLNSPTEIIALTLKKLGKSANETTLPPELRPELMQLQPQAKLYSSTHYLQPLTLDHTWLAVANSADALAMMRRNPNLVAVFPKSGALLNADLWVQPTLASRDDRSQSLAETIATWCNYCLSPAIAAQFSQLSQGIAPSLLQSDAQQFPEELRNNPILNPDRAVFAKSEFLAPKRSADLDEVRLIWEKLRKNEL